MPRFQHGTGLEFDNRPLLPTCQIQTALASSTAVARAQPRRRASSTEVTIEMVWGWSGYGYDWVGGAVSVLVMLVLLAALAGLAVRAVTFLPGRRREGNEPEAIVRRRRRAR